MKLWRRALVAGWLALFPGVWGEPGRAPAAPVLHGLFTEHMVVQRDVPLPVWGTAPPGAKVLVDLAGRKGYAVANAAGEWRVRLAPLPAGGPHRLIAATSAGETVLGDVWAGDVWLCAGQSALARPLQATADAAAESAAAELPGLRFFTVPRRLAATPQTAVAGEWRRSVPAAARDFSAAGYFFGRELVRELKVPIGLIEATWDDTPVAAWTRLAALEQLPSWHSELARFRAAVAAWEKRGARERRPDPANDPRQPGVIYNGMIAPLQGFPIRGLICSQGEGEGAGGSADALAFRHRLAVLIRDWRGGWGGGGGGFPVGLVQLPGRGEAPAVPGESDVALLREAQFLAAQRLPACGLVVTVDLADEARRPREVGRRLARWALGGAAGRPGAVSGPVCVGKETAAGKLLLRFDHAGGGLRSRDGGAVDGFAIAGADGVWVWGTAAVTGDTVAVSAAAVPEPVAARYGWADAPRCNLVGQDGLPAVPFRTDLPADPAP